MSSYEEERPLWSWAHRTAGVTCWSNTKTITSTCLISFSSSSPATNNLVSTYELQAHEMIESRLCFLVFAVLSAKTSRFLYIFQQTDDPLTPTKRALYLLLLSYFFSETFVFVQPLVDAFFPSLCQSWVTRQDRKKWEGRGLRLTGPSEMISIFFFFFLCPGRHIGQRSMLNLVFFAFIAKCSDPFLLDDSLHDCYIDDIIKTCTDAIFSKL